MKEFSNKYIFLFSLIMVFVVAAMLSLVSMQLQPIQNKNFEIEKKRFILASINIDSDAKDAEKKYEQYITESICIDKNGNKVENSKAFDINLKNESSKPEDKRVYPLFIAKTATGQRLYIIPMQGKGLWGPIYGYISLKDDLNTISGVVFDHKSETPGLGAEIKDNPTFPEQFLGKKLFDNNLFKSITVVKGTANKENNHEVNSISGATITSKGVEEMIKNTLSAYQEYIKNNKQ